MYRMNKAPAGTKKWAEHVGHRTTMRVWADQRMPDLSNVWRAANETIVHVVQTKLELLLVD